MWDSKNAININGSQRNFNAQVHSIVLLKLEPKRFACFPLQIAWFVPSAGKETNRTINIIY
jgi:hypothetical protein